MEVTVAKSYEQVTQPFVDGFGERRVMVDARGDRLDVLRVGPTLSSLPSFEAALRERASRIGAFRHPSFSRVRGIEVERTTGTVQVISDHLRGVRLSILLAAAEKRAVAVDHLAASCLIRQAVNAVADWRDQMPDIVHGAISPDRIVIAPDGRLILVEHVLGGALEQLRYSRQQYWEELGVPLPASFKFAINARADILQIGVLALALLLGRRLNAADRFDALPPALALRLSPPMRDWLQKALQLNPEDSFASVMDARSDLDAALGSDPVTEQDSLLLFMARCLALDVNAPPASDDHATQPGSGSDDLPDVDLSTRIEALKAFLAHRSARRERAEADKPETPASPAPAAKPDSPAADAQPQAAAPAPAFRIVGGGTEEPQRSPDETAPHRLPDSYSQPRRSALIPIDLSRRLWLAIGGMVAAAVLVIALVMGVFSSGGQTGALSVSTNPPGIAVTIDGAPQGVTPLSMNLAAGDHLLELQAGTESRRIPVTIRAGSESSQYLEFGAAAAAGATELRIRTEPLNASVTVDGRFVGRSPVSVPDLTPGPHTVVLQHEVGTATEQVLIEQGKTASLFVPLARTGAGAAAATATAAGWVSVAAPVDVQLFENGRFLGSSRIDRIMMPAGRHDLQIVNEALGFEEARTVRVVAGQVATVNVNWPSGTLSINAVPWAEAFLDGKSIGETPIGNIRVPIGTHQIVLRHPQLGERTASVTVTTRDAARVGIDMRTK